MDDLQENATDGEPILSACPPSRYSSIPLVCLNFKVPLHVRQQFKIYAARHNLSMTELLLQILDNLLFSETGSSDKPRALTKQEIKK
jgi:hypothetical protein